MNEMFLIITAFILIGVWIWTIVDIMSNRATGNKLLWILFVLFAPFIGTLFYIITWKGIRKK